jgi:hypothetical protein
MSVPNAPENLNGTIPPGYADSYPLALTWDDTNDGTADTNLYREVQYSGGHELDHLYATVPAGTYSYVDTVEPEHVYIYHATAVNSDGESDRTDEFRILPPTPP